MPDSCEFIFNGRHVREFGATFLVTSWPGAALTTANELSVGGRHGTLRYQGETLGEKRLAGRLYLLSPGDEPLSFAEMLERAQDVCGWLKASGRGRLTLDAAPERFYMAECKSAVEFATDEWPSGCADVTFTLQPFAYDAQESACSLTLAPGAAQEKKLCVPGTAPAPLLMRLTAMGAVSWAEITADGQTLRLENLGLSQGQVLEIGAPLESGEVMTCRANGQNAMRCVSALSAVPFLLGCGTKSLTFSADGACAVRAAVRGRWK